MNYHSGHITKKQNDGRHIFVFGSNLAGRHGKGSALVAKQHWGAVYGNGEGIQGRSYAIPTKDKYLRQRPLIEIANSVEQFLTCACANPQFNFLVVRIGCMLAGYKDYQIAPMFQYAPSNVYLSPEWKEILEGKQPIQPKIVDALGDS